MNFDWKQYVLNYEDLIEKKINTEDKALNHYLRIGIKENRTDKPIKNLYVQNNYDELKKTNSNKIFYISNNTNGGSWKYLMDIVKVLNENGKNAYRIENINQMEKYSQFFRKGDILIFQYLFYSDFTFEDIINYVNLFNLRLVLPIHDNYFLNNYTNKIIPEEIHYKTDGLNEIRKQLFTKATHIIFPSKYICDVYSDFLKLPTYSIVPHIDLKENSNYHRIPKINNKNINFGIISKITNTKGAEEIRNLILKYKSYIKNEIEYNIKFNIYSDSNENNSLSNVIFRGKYNENDIFKKLEEDNIHCLFFLNKWSETFSYALTKGINSGLPIIYTDLGAISERLKKLNKDYYFPTNNLNIVEVFEKMINYIIENNNRCLGKKIENEIDVHEFYKELLLETQTEILGESLKNSNQEFLIDEKKLKRVYIFTNSEKKENYFEKTYDLIEFKYLKEELDLRKNRFSYQDLFLIENLSENNIEIDLIVEIIKNYEIECIIKIEDLNWFSEEKMNSYDKLFKHSKIVIESNEIQIEFSNIFSIEDYKISKILQIDKLFYSTKTNQKNIVIIPSKIIVSRKNLTYSKIRSIYSRQERLNQTIETINSIKKNLKDVFIILIDNSELLKSEYEQLTKNVDIFINPIYNETLKYYTDIQPSKTMAETSQIMYILNYLSKIDIKSVESIFKISGRYSLIEDINHLCEIKTNIFKKNDNVKDRDYYYTSLYKIHSNNFNNYNEAINRIFKNEENYYNKDLEVILPRELNYDFTLLSKLGLKQSIAVWNDNSII